MSSVLHSPTPIRAEHSLFSRPSDTMSRRFGNGGDGGDEIHVRCLLKTMQESTNARKGMWLARLRNKYSEE
jgi:hypothetical protein